MAVTHNELMKRVESETGYNAEIVSAVCNEFLKQTIKELVQGSGEITIQKFMTLKIKQSYKPGTVRGGITVVGPNARRLTATFTETVKRRLPAEGIEAIMQDFWGI